MIPLQISMSAPVNFADALLLVAGGAIVFIVLYFLRTRKPVTDEPELFNVKIFMVGKGTTYEGLMSYNERKAKGRKDSPELKKYLESEEVKDDLEADGLTKEGLTMELGKAYSLHDYAIRSNPSNIWVKSPVPLEDGKYSDLTTRVLTLFGYEGHRRIFAGPGSMDLGVDRDGWRCLYVVPISHEEKVDLPDVKYMFRASIFLEKAALAREEVASALAMSDKWREAFDQASRDKAELAADKAHLENEIRKKHPDSTMDPSQDRPPVSIGLVIGVAIVGLIIGLFVLPSVFKNAYPTANDLASYGILSVLGSFGFAKWRKML